MDNFLAADGLPGVPDGGDPGGGDPDEAGFHMDVQDTRNLFVTGLVPAHDPVGAMDVLANVSNMEENPESRREEAWELCKAFSRELLDRSRKTVESG